MKAVCFDLDGTLIRFKPVRVIVRDFLEERGLGIDLDRIEAALSGLRKPDARGMDPEEYYIELNYAILKRLGFAEYDLAVGLLHYWFDRRNYVVYPDVEEGVAKIRGLGCKVCIASNNLSWEIGRFLRDNGLGHLFDAVISPDKVGTFKPDARFFLEASRVLGVHIGQMIHVGNDPEEDYHGAIRAGAKALLLDRKRIPGEDSRMIVIHGLLDVYEWLVERDGCLV